MTVLTAEHPVLEMIYKSGFSAYLHGYGAIDAWLYSKESAVRAVNNHFIFTNADTADLAKMFENLRFPGVNLADAALDTCSVSSEHRTQSEQRTQLEKRGENHTWYFRCASCSAPPFSLTEPFKENFLSFPLLEFYRDCKSHVFYDPRGIYPLLREIRFNIKTGKEQAGLKEYLVKNLYSDCDRIRAMTDTALILAKYVPPVETKDADTERFTNEMAALLFDLHGSYSPCVEEQRVFLSGLMVSPNPGLGMEMLRTCGYIKRFWPELAALEEADHSKEFHPEGNAWQHTMETFRHRKSGAFFSDVSGALTLSLGLLLHDLGKPVSASTVNHRYEGHAELGEIHARRFLERLGFNPLLIKDVCFLVRNHMLPAALPRLPLYRTSQIMSSPLFPLLMELYRCDESSSFKGLHSYYESSAKYQQFLRNQRNPYRRQSLLKQ